MNRSHHCWSSWIHPPLITTSDRFEPSITIIKRWSINHQPSLTIFNQPWPAMTNHHLSSTSKRALTIINQPPSPVFITSQYPPPFTHHDYPSTMINHHYNRDHLTTMIDHHPPSTTVNHRPPSTGAPPSGTPGSVPRAAARGASQRGPHARWRNAKQVEPWTMDMDPLGPWRLWVNHHH